MHYALSSAQQTAAVRYCHHVLNKQTLPATENSGFDGYSIMNRRLESNNIYQEMD